LSLPALLYGWVTWAIREQDKCRITSAEMKFIRRKVKYKWQDYKTNEDIVPELNISPVANKIQNYNNKWVKILGEWTERQTATLNLLKPSSFFTYHQV
jgi:hypothetical protein